MLFVIIHETARTAKRHLQIYDIPTPHVHTSTAQLPPRRLRACTRAYWRSRLIGGLNVAMDWEVISEQALRHVQELLPSQAQRDSTVSVGKPTPPLESSSGTEQQSMNGAEGAASSTPGSPTWKRPCRYNYLANTWRYHPQKVPQCFLQRLQQW